MKFNFNKNGLANPFWIFFGILAVVGLVLLFSFSTRWMLSEWGHLGAQGGGVPLGSPFSLPDNLPGSNYIESFMISLFNPGDFTLTWQMLILQLVIFAIFGIAFGDILEQFSTFRKPVAVSIGWLMALIASLTGIVRMIMIWLGLTAGLGAIGLGLVFVNAIVVFTLINLTVGARVFNSLKQAQSAKQAAMTANKVRGAYATATASVNAINQGINQGNQGSP